MFRNNRQSKQSDENTTGNVKKFSFVGNVLIIVIVVIIAIGVCGTAIWLGVASLPANRISRYMGAAERYLGEMNYEQAIIEFERILEIDPMNEDAIIGLADAYAGIGNREKAIEVLNNGFELTGARRIERRLNKLQEPITSSNGEDSNGTNNQPTQPSGSSESQSGMPSNSSEPEMRDIHPESEYDDLVFVGDYGYTSVFGNYDDPYGGKDHFYAVKKVDGGVVELKESNYPVFVSDDGIITYYGYKNNESVQIIIEDAKRNVISKTVIYGSTNQLYIGFGACVDRIRRAFNGCDFAFFEADDCTYIFGKDGFVKNTKSLNIPSVRYWAPYIEGVGTLTYVRGSGSEGDYYYFPDLDKVYKDELPLTITENGVKLKKFQPTKTNYGSIVVYCYCTADAEIEIDGTIATDDSYYVIADFSTGKITKAYKNIETIDGKTFKATDSNGKTFNLDANGNEIGRSSSTSSVVPIKPSTPTSSSSSSSSSKPISSSSSKPISSSSSGPVTVTASESDFKVNDIEDGVEIEQYNGRGGDVVIPSTINGKKVLIIGEGAFSNRQKITGVTIPNSVIEIERVAFFKCENLTRITIPNSVTKIGGSAFSGCSNLASIDIPNSVTWIGGDAFYSCTSLTKMNIPNSVSYIGSGAFCNCPSLTNITIPNSITELREGVFASCSSLTSITIPNSVTKIGARAFNNTGLITVIIPNSVTVIDEAAFCGCPNLIKTTIPNSVTKIGANAFENCVKLTSITIPGSVEWIGNWAFCKCSSLKSVTISEGVKWIDAYAFDRCTSLTDITIPEGVDEIDYRAFRGCTSLTTVHIPNSVTQLSSAAFEDCINLTNITYDGNIYNYSNISDLYTAVKENLSN